MYFIGKMLWAKGHRELLDLLTALADATDGVQPAKPGALTYLQKSKKGDLSAGSGREHVPHVLGAGVCPEVDIYGSGPDRAEITAAAQRLSEKLEVRVHPGIDHAHPEIHDYKIFVNPSRSDVLCTTTAEALAMGKFAIIEDNPSNSFFKKLPNCLTYRSPAEFVTQVQYALSAEPQPLDKAQRYLLSWEAATDRLLDAIVEEVPSQEGPNLGDRAFAAFHQSLFRGRFGDWSRGVLGAGPIAHQYDIVQKSEAAAPAEQVVTASIQMPARTTKRERGRRRSRDRERGAQQDSEAPEARGVANSALAASGASARRRNGQRGPASPEASPPS